jgi:hypothetical protein
MLTGRGTEIAKARRVPPFPVWRSCPSSVPSARSERKAARAAAARGRDWWQAAVRPLEQFAVRETGDQPGVNDASPSHAWNVARVRADPVEVPDRFAGLRVVIDEKPAAILAKIPVKPQGESGRWPISTLAGRKRAASPSKRSDLRDRIFRKNFLNPLERLVGGRLQGHPAADDVGLGGA